MADTYVFVENFDGVEMGSHLPALINSEVEIRTQYHLEVFNPSDDAYPYLLGRTLAVGTDKHDPQLVTIKLRIPYHQVMFVLQNHFNATVEGGIKFYGKDDLLLGSVPVTEFRHVINFKDDRGIERIEFLAANDIYLDNFVFKITN